MIKYAALYAFAFRFKCENLYSWLFCGILCPLGIRKDGITMLSRYYEYQYHEDVGF